MRLARVLRWFAALVLAPAFLWSAYWIAAVYGAQWGVNLALTEARQAGATVDFQTVAVSGYPTRFDLRVAGPTVSVEGVTWASSEVQAMAESARPHDIHIDLSHPQRLAGRFGAFEIDTALATLTILFRPDWDMPLAEIALSARDVRIWEDGAWGVNIQNVLASSFDAADGDTAYGVEVALGNINLAEVLSALPVQYHVITKAEVLSNVVFDKAWDRRIFDRGAPLLQTLDLQRVQFDFGAAEIALVGQLSADDGGALSGVLSLSLVGWAELFELAKQQGYVEPAFEDVALSLLSGLAAQDGVSDTLSLPLVVQQGMISYGALTLGVLPRLQ